MGHAVQPNGAIQEVGVDELFFSVTDGRGVIESSNEVFVRLSRYSRGELMTAPHNIIRHPEMPGAAFRLMWDTIEEGKPFAAYVRNLAADGTEYDVFATVTPLPGHRYLSVRTRPVRDDLFDAAKAINTVHDGRGTISSGDLAELQSTFHLFMDDILGLRSAAPSDEKDEAYRRAVDLLLSIRQQAKQNKDWATSDRIRNELSALGFVVKDTKDGAEWSL